MRIWENRIDAKFLITYFFVVIFYPSNSNWSSSSIFLNVLLHLVDLYIQWSVKTIDKPSFFLKNCCNYVISCFCLNTLSIEKIAHCPIAHQTSKNRNYFNSKRSQYMKYYLLIQSHQNSPIKFRERNFYIFFSSMIQTVNSTVKVQFV